MQGNGWLERPPQVRAGDKEMRFDLPHFGKRIPKREIVASLLGWLLTTQPLGAQTVNQPSIFTPWSDQDVRQGASTRPETRAVPREFTQAQPATMPKDSRQSSSPNPDAIPIFRKSNRDDLEDIRLGSRPDHQRGDASAGGATRSSARSSFITLQPFSDADLRQGSRYQPGTMAPTKDVPSKSIQAQPEKDKKGFFGRALEKIGF
jgi:hypothetical protein